jgi:hypothetical protein
MGLLWAYITEKTFNFVFIDAVALGIYGPLTKTVVNLSPRLYINNAMMIQYDYCVQMSTRPAVLPYKAL